MTTACDGASVLAPPTARSADYLCGRRTPNNGTLTGSPLSTWVSGEEEITFTDGVQTGAVTAWGTFRERMVMRLDSDSIAEAFLRTIGKWEDS